jgi:hypothetical protein
MSSEIKVDTISEQTSANGVAIDSLGIKDGKITNLMNATLNAADLGNVHIKTADSSAATHTSADELVLENSGHCGISILSGTASTGNIYWNDSGGTARGYIQYNHDGDEIAIGNNGATSINMTSDGEVTKARQPAFLVKPTNNQTDFNQGQTITIVLDNEIYDIGSNFASNTFTAPVTGKYCFQFSIQLNDISNQDSSTYYYIELNTSNRAYYVLSSIDQAVGSSAGQYFFTLAGGALADMDANDTMTLRVVHGGTSGSGPSDVSNNSHLSGFLAC